MKRAVQCVALMACISVFGQSNPIEGGMTETVTNVWNVPLPWLIVGGNSDSNALIVSDGGQVNNAIGYIGNAVTSTDNGVLVTGSGSEWNNSMELSVGYQGAGNALTVADGGTVTAPETYIGNNSDSNQVTVTGSNSLLDAANLNVGYQGDDNRLLVADGGTVESDTGTIGYWINSDGNIATVQSNGIWNSSAELNIGEYGSGNRLVVGSGGLAESPVVNVGVQSISSNNTVTVTGDDAWLDAPELYIGGSAAGAGATGNRVEVENGGTVYTESLNIYSNNAFDLNNGGRLFINTNFNASLNNFNFNAGGTLEVGGELTGMTNSIEDQRSLVLNGSSAQWDMSLEDIKVGESTAGNSLSVINGGLMENQNGYIGYASAADSNSVFISGSNTAWNSLGVLHVGYEGSDNSLTISDGAYVKSLIGEIGARPDSVNNNVLITGAGSVWDTTNAPSRGRFTIGKRSSGNTLVIADGGRLTSAYAIVGDYGGSNSVLVTGAGSVWDNMTPGGATGPVRALFVGNHSSGNSLEVLDGGSVYTYLFGVGGGRSSNNTVTVSGAGSLLDAAGNVTLGFISDGNELTVSDGGRAEFDREFQIGVSGGDYNTLNITGGGAVYNENGYIGYNSAADSNSVLVTGSGSVWQNQDGLYLGGRYSGTNWIDGGTGNSLTIEDGGWVLVGDIDTNDIPETGDLSAIVVGDSSGTAEMIVINGSLVASDFSALGIGANDSGRAIVNGDGSRWDSRRDFFVGYNGSGNTLEISDGGHVYNDYGFIGHMVSSSRSNSVLVSGSGSVWSNREYVVVGTSGSDNTLSIVDGGQVLDSRGVIGFNAGSDGNTVFVEGTGSVWSNRDGLAIGESGSANMLSITTGGYVYSEFSVIGAATNSSNNSVLVNGAESVWSNRSGVAVGVSGEGNALTISNGGQVYNNSASVGKQAISSNNLALVTGAGSVWNNTGALSVGNQGSGNELSVEDGGLVENQNGYIGYASGANSNSVLVTGSGSVWQNYEGLYLGGHYEGTNWVDGGTGNSLTVENGGRVLVGEVDAGSLAGIGGGIAVGSSSSDEEMVAANGSLVNTENTWIGFGSNHVTSVRVSGSNTVWNSSADFYVGYQGEGNSLLLEDGSLVSAGGNLYNRNASTVYLDPGTQVSIGGDYYQDATAMLRFGVETNAAGAPVNALITVGGTAEFEENAKIEYASNVGELLFDRFYTNKLIEADALVVAGIENPDSLDLELLDASGSLVDVIFWENEQDIYALAGRKYLADSAGFAEGSMMARLSKEIDDMSLLGNSEALNMIYLLNDLTGSQQHKQLVRQYEYTAPSYLHVQGMTEGLGELAKHVSRRPAPAPEGAAGPYSVDRGARGWVRPYGQWSDRSDQDGFSGYDHNVYGTLVGMDWIQDHVLLGIAGGYARSKIKQDDGGESKADTGYGVFFASVGTKDWFGDINVAFGRSDIDDDSDTVFGGQADYKANNYALYIGGGREIRSRSGRFSFTPEASLLLSEYDQESYSENMGTGVAREVEDYDRSSVVSSLGAAVAMQQEYDEMILRPEARFRWLHEFEDDGEKLDFTLSEGMGGQYFSLMPAAEEDILEVGTGITFTFHDEFSLALDLDWRFGEDYDAYSFSGRAILEF